MTEMKKQQRTFVGEVVSNKMDKTAVVKIVRTKQQKKYKKRYQVSTKFKAHDPENAYHVGDIVRIREVRPYSKEKRWLIIGKEEKR